MKPNHLGNKTMLLAGLAIALCGGQVAHAQYNLIGNYIGVGVGPDGSIINPTAGSNPALTGPTYGGSYSSLLGIIYTPTGLGQTAGFPVNNDIITPGNPFQMSSLGVNGNFAAASYEAADYGVNLLGGTTVNTSSGSTLSTLTTGGGFAGVSLSQTLSFNKNSTIISYAVTLQNTTGSTLNNISYATGFDPDPDVYQYGSYYTQNNILSPSVVQASGPSTGNTILIQAVTPGDVPSIIPDWVYYDPYGLLGSSNPYGYSGGYDGEGDFTIGSEDDGDYAIYEAWDISSLAPGASTTIDFNYIINATPVTTTSPILGPPTAPDMGSTLTMLGLALAGLNCGKRFIGKRQ
jgi:hypothetical protein